MPDSKVTFQAPVTFAAAAEGEEKKVPRFDVVAYTGVPMILGGWDLPVAVDIAGMTFSKNIVANLDHDAQKRVGHVTSKDVANGEVRLSGFASAATAARDEVVQSAKDGFVWEASIEAYLDAVEEIAAGETATVNDREVAGPAMIARKSKLVGFGFVPHGADDNTSAKIAASPAPKPNSKGNAMKLDNEPKLRDFIVAMLPGTDIEKLSEEAITNLRADFEGKEGIRKPTKIAAAATSANPFEAKKAEHARKVALEEISLEWCERNPHDIEAIQKCHDHAVEAGMTPKEFRLELWESAMPESQGPIRPRERDELSGDVIEAAICLTGGLRDIDKHYSERTLDAASREFRGGIGLKQLWCMAAKANGHRNNGYQVTEETQEAAFMKHGRMAKAAGFSTYSLPNILSNVANKFIRIGWESVDQTPLNISARRSVSDFKQTTTVSLVADSQFEQVAPGGEITHGDLSEVVYNNQADTYGRMFGITRKDIINDDLGALTRLPTKLGRGAMLKLNDIFWTVFLNNSAFFTAGNNNVSTTTGTLTDAGLTAAETIFMNQVDPDGYPLGAMPQILLVPTALKAAAKVLMDSQKRITGEDDTFGDANIWSGRFRVESSPYMSNASYTGFSAAAWYMLADPVDIPVIEIAALNGRIEPQVDTADAPFNTLGVQMRGYNDVGVALQEYRGGVRADGD